MQIEQIKTLPVNERIETLFAALTNIEKLWVGEYIITKNKTKAALKAGLSAHTAMEQGCAMYRRPHVRAAVDAVFEVEAMSAFELIHMTVEAARGNLGDCMSTRKVEYTPRVKMPLAKVIDQKQMEIDIIMTYLAKANPNEKKRKQYMKRVASINDAMVQLESELAHNPKAFRMQAGETVFKDQKYLDIKKVVDRGLIIDKVEHDKNGNLKVSIISPTVARQDLLKMAGLYEKDNKQKSAQVIINLLGDDALLGSTIEI